MVKATKLNRTFAELGMDPSFVQQARLLGLQTIADIMAVNLPRLKKHPNFTYTWYANMLDLLQAHNLLKKFQADQL